MRTRLFIFLFSVMIVSVVLAATPTPGLNAPIDDPTTKPEQAVSSEPTSEEETPDGWEQVATGIEYRKFKLDTPVDVFVTRMDRNNPNVIIESSIAEGRLSGGHDTVSQMADRYDQALNYWGQPTIPVTPTWGSRNKVVVAINGYFYGPEKEPPGVPWKGQIHSGWYAKRFYDHIESGFVWMMDRSAFIGGCVTHPASKQYIDFDSGSLQETQEFQGINIPREDNKLIIYTPQYDSKTLTEDGKNTVEVLVEMESPTFIALARNVPIGIVRDIRDGKGSTPIPFDHIVLSAHGTAKTTLLDNIKIGDRIGIAQKIKDHESDCNTPSEINWERSYAGIGGDFYFLKDGVIQEFEDDNAKVRDPRTAVAYNDDYIYFIVADGRNPLGSFGMTIHELAIFAKDTLTATEGIAQDGGGSSTMWVNGAVKNNVFCNNGNCPFHLYLPLITKTGKGSNSSPQLTTVPPTTNTSPPKDNLTPTMVNSLKNGQSIDESDKDFELLSELSSFERAVANGLMMVVVEPITKTTTFTPTDQVITLYNSNVRLGPGTNYAVITTVPVSTTGVVLDHMNGLNGVLAKNYNWWKVEFPDGVIGWIAESLLSLDESEQ